MNDITINQQLQTAVQAAVSKADSIIINNPELLTQATDIVKFIKEKGRQVEHERKALVDPLNSHVKTINAKFKNLSEPLDRAEVILKQKMLSYQRALEAERREAEEVKRKELVEYARQAALDAKQDSNEEVSQEISKAVSILMSKPIEIEKVRGGATGAVSSITKRWTYRVLDIKALANARPELVEPTTQLRKEVLAGVRDIPGIEIYQEESIGIR